MDNLIYNYSLCIDMTLMLFISFYFLFGKTPDKPIFDNYLKSRRLMSLAVLLLVGNYCIHFFLRLRFTNPTAAILVNLSTYFLCYWVFIIAMHSLLNRFYISKRRSLTHISIWIAYTALVLLVGLHIPKGAGQTACVTGLALCLMAYGLYLSLRFLRIYRRAIKQFDNTSSEDLSVYVRWMNHFTYFILIYGVACSALTFLAEEYVYLWILSSIPLYVYLFCCYQNYLLFYERVESVIVSECENENKDESILENDTDSELENNEIVLAHYNEIAVRMNEWIKNDGYISPGLTLKELADKLRTNRTYLSGYINSTYKTTFRNWINDLRMEYAKRRMTNNPEQKLAEIAEASGFMSLSHFMRTFKEKEGCSPAKWKKGSNEK